MRLHHGFIVFTVVTIALVLPGVAAGASWKVQSTPNPSGAVWSRLESVSCTSTSACIAVGVYANGLGELKPLAEEWEGKAWNLMTVPLPKGATEATLRSVSCTQSNRCMAVGSSNSASPTLAEHWEGKAWTVQSTVNPSESVGAVFNGVSCTNFTECYAVGGYQNETLLDSFTLVERWNGSTWEIETAASPSESTLASVSCKIPGGVFCMAVGTKSGGTFSDYLMKGSKWIEEATPNATVNYQQLESVSCLSSSNELECTTVGYHLNGLGKDNALAERWNRTEWVVQGPTNGSGTNTILHGVSCPSLTSCVAVGFTGAPSSWSPFAEGWTSEWLSQTASNPSGASEARLQGVSCPVATECAAVGDYVNKSGVEVTLAEVYD